MENIEVKDINQKNIKKILEDRGMTQFREERRPLQGLILVMHFYILNNHILIRLTMEIV
jgi:hypothetical protein